MTMFLDGLRVTTRTLRKQPVFATVVILSLALAIALNTTMYGVLDAMTHPRLDMRSPDRLYWVRFFGDYKFHVDHKSRDAALASGMHSYEAITRSTSVGMLSGLIERGQNFAEGAVATVGENYFDVLGSRVLAGRTFIPSDVESSSAPVVITDELATKLFPSGESAVGARIEIDRIGHVVVGVVSHASNFPREQYVAWSIAPFINRGVYFRLIRLRPGVSKDVAERELAVVANRIAQEAGDDPRSVAFRFTAAADPKYQVKGFDLALLFAVASVLLVACANLANLQLARGLGRRRDLALRAALGATRKRIVAHLLMESAVLAVGGLLTGLLLTYLGGRLLRASIPPSMGDYAVEPYMSWRVLLFALAAMLLCLLLVGLAPALYVSRADPNELLKSGAGTGATKRNRRQYGVLVAVEIALALALTSGAALTLRSALRTREMWYGFDPRSLVVGNAGPTVAPGTVLRYSDLLQSIASRVRAIPGVSDAATSRAMGTRVNGITVEDPGGVRELLTPVSGITAVSPSYLRTMRIPIIRGRDFFDGERDAAAVIVDEQTASVLWPNADPVGAQIKFGDLQSNAPYVRVVGVVGVGQGVRIDPVMRSIMRGVKQLGRIYYLPGPTDTLVAGKWGVTVQFTARARGDGSRLPITIRHEIEGWSATHSSRVISMDEYMGVTRQRESTTFVSGLFTLFAALGVGLASFGVYGVVAHSVAERRRELGVRIALGATARDIVHAVLRDSVMVALIGIAGGLLATKYGVFFLRALAFEDDLYNAPLFGLVALALGATAVVAAMIPALRATRVDPTESLRND
jgi:putative ABC transport system permease protein